MISNTICPYYRAVNRFCCNRKQFIRRMKDTQQLYTAPTSQINNITLQYHCCYSSSSSSRSNSDSRQQCNSLPKQYLEAYNDNKFDFSTHQRNDVIFDPVDGKPPPPSSPPSTHSATRESAITKSKDWIDTHMSKWRADTNNFDISWQQSMSTTHGSTTHDASKRILWSNWTEDIVRDSNTSPILFEYDNLVNDNVIKDATNLEHERILKVLYQYGLVLITGTQSYTDSLPVDAMSEATKKAHAANNNSENTNKSAESAILQLAAIIGYHPLQTLYGSGVWSTSSQSSFYDNNANEDETSEISSSASIADSAYGSTSLPLHTDMTYLSTPPGVQVFLMVQPAETTTSLNDDTTPSAPSSNGNNKITSVPKGQSIYLDGFAAARQLQIENPEAYCLLTSTQRTYRCIDNDEGWHLETTGPVIETITSGKNDYGPVKSIRHNDLDRLPDLPPYPTNESDEGFDSFYDNMIKAHNAWDDILRRDSMRLVIDLKPGDCILVANQRCMHGRYAFETSSFPRVVMGCYVGMDELSSKWRRAGLRVV